MDIIRTNFNKLTKTKARGTMKWAKLTAHAHYVDLEL